MCFILTDLGFQSYQDYQGSIPTMLSRILNEKIKTEISETTLLFTVFSPPLCYESKNLFFSYILLHASLVNFCLYLKMRVWEAKESRIIHPSSQPGFPASRIASKTFSVLLYRISSLRIILYKKNFEATCGFRKKFCRYTDLMKSMINQASMIYK